MSGDKTPGTKRTNPGSSAAAISHHYDVGNEFFELWLDKALTYSCAFNPHALSLDAAQRAKLDMHLRACKAVGAKRLLDVGCGWGAGLVRAVEEFSVHDAVGLTLSMEQAAYIQNRYANLMGSPGIDVRVESWSAHEPEAPYDGILSLGAFEHFARPGATSEVKISGYRNFFELCRDWLRPSGWFALQTIVWGRSGIESGNAFLMQEIYPETDVPELAEICTAVKGLFEIRRLELDREAYVATLTEWRRRLRNARHEAIRVAGPEIYARYERYLGLCILAFHSGNLNLARLALRRID